MTFFPDVKSLDKLLNNDWKTLVYGEQSKTWNEKLYSFACEAWSQILTLLESRGRQLQNYWPLYAAFFVGLFIILATYKLLRYINTIKLRKIDKCERRVKQEICTEDPRIISNDVNNDNESLIEKPCPTSRSDLDNATATPADNDYKSRHDSRVSSETTIVAVEIKESSEFLRNLINSIQPGDDVVDDIVSTKSSRQDAEENKEILDLSESTRQKFDSNNCKYFYVLTPWIEPSEESCTPAETLLPRSPVSADDTKAKSLMDQNFISRTLEPEEINKNVTDHSDLVNKSGSPKAITVNEVLTDDGKSTGQMSEPSNSTLAIHHESSSICCADDVLSRISDTGENIHLNPSTEPPCNNLERVLSNYVETLPEIDLSPISREPLKIENTINITASAIPIDSKHRFRSLSHDNRTVSSTEYIDIRRGSSVSPPARDKNKQRSIKQMQSKIPTLSPLAHRQMHQHLGTDVDGPVAETAKQIRSVLLRKLKEVWEQHSRDGTPSPDRSMNSSLDSSIYYTPESISRIPLPRRSPRHSDANDPIRSPRLYSQSDRSANQSGQSRQSGYSGITNERSFPDDVSAVPLHSTPKTWRDRR